MQICHKRDFNFKTVTKTKNNPRNGGAGSSRAEPRLWKLEVGDLSRVEYVSCVALFVGNFSAQLGKFHENVSHSMRGKRFVIDAGPREKGLARGSGQGVGGNGYECL